uniref:Malate dehydrogenase, cytoplasmic n=1 Tax=Lygus hesperus TaxID=30085 RepID=A0A0A9Z2B4_LYGHE
MAAPDCHILVVGNPANTNALVLLKSSKGKLRPDQVTAMSRLDFNRLQAQIAVRANVPINSVQNPVVWGNHSSTMVPDVNTATVNGKPARKVVNDDAFLDGPLIPLIQKRGAEVIALRGLSSAMSAAKAAVDHMHDWVQGTPEGSFVCMSVYSTGNTYGVADDLIYSFPCTCKNGKWTIVKDLTISPEVKSLMEITQKELVEEKEAAGFV